MITENTVAQANTNPAIQKKKIHFISLGCPKNLVDSEIMAGTLMNAGYEIAPEAEGSDTVIVNTCGFVEDAKQESIESILAIAKAKEAGHVKRLVVAGCLAQRYKEELVSELPEADLFIGSGEFQNIAKILHNNDIGEAKKAYFHLPTFLQLENTPRVNSQPRHRAYLKISEGCLKRCSFCAIPLIRGNLQSRTLDNIVNEAKLLAAGGVKELLIVSHDFTDYGWDLRKKDPNCKESPESLLRALDKVEGIEWIRMLYLYPDGITDEMISIFKDSKKILKYFDMPLQHINDQMLKSMNRKMTRAEIEERLNKIRSEIPDAVIRTQFIVGYPGETPEQFQELLDFVKEQNFDRVGCFKYSPEENTPGGKLQDQVEDSVKDLRHDQLMAAQKKISKKQHKRFVGQTMQVLVEGLSEESELLLQGRNCFQAPDIDGIVFINKGSAEVGQFVDVKITASFDYDLVGEIVEHG